MEKTSSFGSIQVRACQLTKAESTLIDIDSLVSHGIRRTPLLEQLRSKMLNESELFLKVKCSESVKREIELSLCSIFVPVCHLLNASIDTAALAYEICARAFVEISPRMSPTRNAIYVASLLIAFKYNEEDDPHISDICKIIDTWPRKPPTFVSPWASKILKLEHRMMNELKWNISNIVTPMILAYSLLDCILPVEVGPQLKVTIGQSLENLSFEFFTKTERKPPLMIKRWMIQVIAREILKFSKNPISEDHTELVNYLNSLVFDNR